MPSYYKMINGVKYDSSLLKQAEVAAADGEVSLVEAQRLLKNAQDGPGITDIEWATLEYIAKNNKLSDAASAFFRDALDGKRPSSDDKADTPTALNSAFPRGALDAKRPSRDAEAERPAASKRSRLSMSSLSMSSVQEHLRKVRDAVSTARGRSDRCVTMLDQMALGSLMDGIDERDEIQADVTGLVKKVIEEIKYDLEDRAEKARNCVEQPEVAKATMDKELPAAEQQQEEAQEDLNRKIADLGKAREAKKAAEVAANSAAADKKEADAVLQKLETEKVKYADAFREHFIPIRDGTWQHKVDADVHFNVLTPLFRAFDYEGSLIAAFKPAGLVKPRSNRRPFDETTIRASEQGFHGSIEELNRQGKEQIPACAQADEECKNAADKLKKKEGEERGAAFQVGLGRRKLDHAKRAAEAARMALTNFPTTPKEALEAMNRADQDLQKFMEGAYASFIYLRDRVAELEKSQ